MYVVGLRNTRPSIRFKYGKIPAWISGVGVIDAGSAWLSGFLIDAPMRFHYGFVRKCQFEEV